MVDSYTRYRRYAQAQSDSPNTVLNGADFDVDYDRIKVVCDALVAALAQVRRDDGQVANTTIGVDQLKTEVISLLSGVTPRGNWVTSTAYAQLDLVRNSNVLYFALTAHTSGTFATDLAAGKWMAISAATGGANVSNVPAGNIAATDVQAAINELDTEKQPLDATLTAIAGLTMAADKIIYGTGTDAVALATLTAAARTVLDDTTVAAMLATLGGLPLAGGTMTGTLVLAAAPTGSLDAATKAYVDAAVATKASPVRQTVLGGPVSGTTGLPNAFPGTSASLSLTTTGVSSTVPWVVGSANGFGYLGAVNLIGYSSSNRTWSALTASRAAATPNFLYETVSSDGSMATGSTILPPIYQWGGVPSTTVGQFTFNIATMIGYMGNGSTAPQANIVFVGEAATDGSGVISTVQYAYQGRYDGGWTATLSNAGVVQNANIGAEPSLYNARYTIQCTTTNLNWAVGDTFTNAIANSSGTEVPVPVYVTRNKVGIPVLAAHLAIDKTATTNTGLTVGSWKYKFAVDRGW